MTMLITKWALGVLLTALLGLISWPIKAAFRKTKEALETVAEIKSQVDTAVNNHLHHIQESTNETNSLLRSHTERTSELLREQNGDVRELLGYLRGRH